jgi:MFS family permease
MNLLVCVPLHLLVLPRRPKAVLPTRSHGPGSARAPGLGHALRRPEFYFFATALVCNGFIFAALSVHMIPILQAKGLSALGAAGVAAMVGPMQVAGRVMESTVGRRFPMAKVGLLALASMPVALILLFAANEGSWTLVLFAALYGSSNGVFTIVRGAMPAELFGREHYGAINGALSAPYLVSHALGPTIAALLWSMLGEDYGRAVLALSLVSFVGIGAYWAATRHITRQGHEPVVEPESSSTLVTTPNKKAP